MRWRDGLYMLLALSLVPLVACTQQPPTEPAPVFDEDLTTQVSVTGRLVPEVWTAVAATSAGQVIEVLVQPGDVVAAGDLLFRLDDRGARVAVHQAEAAVKRAQEHLAQIKAGPSAAAVTTARAQVEAARVAVTQTVRQRDQLLAGQLDAQLAEAAAQIAVAQAEQLVARQQHDDTMRCEELQRPDGTIEKVCPALGTLEERARYTLNAANLQLAAAEAHEESLRSQHYARVQVAEAAIEVARQQLAVAEAQFAALTTGPTEEEIAIAEVGILEAQAALEAAELSLAQTRITAPIAGTVGAVDVRIGAFITPGVPCITLGDLSTLRVETTDLNEIDVARIAVDQQALVVFDALPGTTFEGAITHIAPMADSSASVDYTVVVELSELDPALRWGMTAFVDIPLD